MTDRPRVTQVLAEMGLGPNYAGIAPEVLHRASQRGIALHKTIALHHKGTLDVERLHPEIRPGYDAYLRFLQDTGHVPWASEFEVVHPEWDYVGHPDRLGHHGESRLGAAIYDWKYVASLDVEAVTYQVAAYRAAVNAKGVQDGVYDGGAVRGYAVHLKRDGTYRLISLTEGLDEAERIFYAALIVWRARQRRR